MRLPRLPAWAPWAAGAALLAAVLFKAWKPPSGGGGGFGGFGGTSPEPAPLPPIDFIEAAHLGKGRPAGAPNAIVIHTAETEEKPGAARAVANYFATTDVVASAHYTVDDAEIVQSVKEEDQAWHAAGYNARSIGIEHAGRAKQDAADWQDPYSDAMLRLSAKLAAQIATRYGIPAVRLTGADLLAGKPGFVGHDVVSKTFHKSDHTDPGAGFPWDYYLGLVQAEMEVA